MIDLLIAILIALGCSVQSGATEEELRAQDPVAYERATQIYESGSYKTTDDGGIVIVEVGGD